MKRIYTYIRNYLRNHGKLALILSHGFIHIILVIALLTICLCLYKRTQDLNTPSFKHLAIQVKEYTGNAKIEELQILLNLKEHSINNFTTKESSARIVAKLSEPEGSKRIPWPVEDGIKDLCDCSGSIYMCALSGELGTTYNFSEATPFYGFGAKENKAYIDTFSVAILQKYDKWIGQDWYFSERIPQYRYTNENISRIMWLDYKGSSLFKDSKDISPYYNFWISITCDLLEDKTDTDYIEPNSVIIIKYSDRDSLGSFLNPISIDKIIPEPSMVQPNRLAYIGNQKVQEVLRNQGIYFMGVDLLEKNKAEKKVFLYTILIGTLLAFILDILVELIIKWRRLAQSKNK